MNLWFRLLCVLLAAPWRSRLDPRTGISRLSFRVLPHDLDANLHMNNGRYLTIMDLGRIDFVLRSGLWRPLWRNGWAPIASAVVIRFRRELRPFEAYWLDTRIVAWSDTTAVMEQTFMPKSGRSGQAAARALMKAGFYERSSRSFVTVKRLISVLGIAEGEAESPPPTAEVEAFLKAESALRRPADKADEPWPGAGG
jgi:acyl-CoA thioesterase FadM